MKSYRIRIDDHVYTVAVHATDTNPVIVTVDGESFEVWLEEGRVEAVNPAAHTLTPAPMQTEKSQAHPPVAASSNGRERIVKAPIPGVVTAILVKPGEQVQTGQVLCNLEAMKMNNAIRASRDGVIGAVLVAHGQHVRHQETLMEFSD
jgi:glutaconyl-CoA/methylmalonyl-CoA decarboxylase subunit gamma